MLNRIHVPVDSHKNRRVQLSKYFVTTFPAELKMALYTLTDLHAGKIFVVIEVIE